MTEPVDEMLDREARQFVARLRTKKPRGVHYAEEKPAKKRGNPEMEQQEAVVSWLRKQGCIVSRNINELRSDEKDPNKRARFWFKLVKTGCTEGFPDVTVALPDGRTAYIEMKAPGKAPSEKQRKLHEALEARGHIVVWGTCVWSVQDALRARGVVFGRAA